MVLKIKKFWSVNVRNIIFLSFLTSMMAGGSGYAQDVIDDGPPGRFAVGLYLGTPGVGGDIQFKANDRFILRAGGHYLDFGLDREIDGIDYDTDLTFSNAFLSVDLHPWKNGWFLSGGAILGAKRLDLEGQLAGPVEIGDQVFTPAEIGTLVGDVELNTAAPFVGLGFDNALTSSRNWGFSVLAGVAFTGEPDVALTAEDGLLAGSPELLASLEDEAMQIQDDIDAFRFYPILRLGITRRF